MLTSECSVFDYFWLLKIYLARMDFWQEEEVKANVTIMDLLGKGRSLSSTLLVRLTSECFFTIMFDTSKLM